VREVHWGGCSPARCSPRRCSPLSPPSWTARHQLRPCQPSLPLIALAHRLVTLWCERHATPERVMKLSTRVRWTHQVPWSSARAGESGAHLNSSERPACSRSSSSITSVAMRSAWYMVDGLVAVAWRP
jgi:hypothetical protein